VAEGMVVLGLLGCVDATRPDLRLLSVAPDSVVVSLRDSIRVVSRLVSEGGDSLAIAPSAWIVFDTSVATATPTGVVRGLKVGGTTLAVASDGVVRTVPVAVVTSFRAVANGAGSSAYGLTEDSATYFWGDTAKAIPGAPPFASVSAGGGLGCGLTAAGAAYCWGWGPLGNGQHRSESPVPVAPSIAFRSLSVGTGYACGVSTGGEVWCWGASYYFVTGPDGQAETEYPVRVPFPNSVIPRDVSAGGYHACVLSTTDSVWCWGYARYGQLGVDPGTLPHLCPRGCSAMPVAVTGGLTFASVTAGETHTCGITTTGVAYCWGDNWTGALGDTLRSACSYTGTPCTWTPIPVRETPSLASLTAGADYTCGLTATGTALCWGSNAGGRFGNGSVEWSSVPVASATGVSWESLSAGSDRTCGRSRAGIAYCWGRSPLGAGPNHGSLLPERVWFQR